MAKIEHNPNIIDIDVPVEIREKVNWYLEDLKKQGKSIANRGQFDGNYADQFRGLVTESVVRHYHTGEYIDFDTIISQADGGIDYTSYGCNYDVKSSRRGRKCDPNGTGFWNKNDYSWDVNYSDLQMSDYYKSDIIVFCFYIPQKNDIKTDCVQILGWYPKSLIRTNSVFRKKGEEVYNDAQESFIMVADGYNLNVKHLFDFNELEPEEDVTKHSCPNCGSRLRESEVLVAGDVSKSGYSCDKCQESFEFDLDE